MGICAGLAEPKSEHVKKALVLLLFFEGDIGSTVGSRERFRPHVRFAYRFLAIMPLFFPRRNALPNVQGTSA